VVVAAGECFRLMRDGYVAIVDDRSSKQIEAGDRQWQGLHTAAQGARRDTGTHGEICCALGLKRSLV
jgi:hypothetical protein